MDDAVGLQKQYSTRIRKHNEDLHIRGIIGQDLPEISPFMQNLGKKEPVTCAAVLLDTRQQILLFSLSRWCFLS